MLSMTRTAGDLKLDVEKTLRNSNVSFSDDQKIGDNECINAARRCAEASINRRKKDPESVDRENGKDDERTCATISLTFVIF